ncbi:hypothetical protein [Mesorhizobium abyssinicae]|uniref:hypothetical protein n=1 Tax=Mesorhizobium abyssinicae TaxID=1209958 RepID=UPI003395F440
MTNMDLEHPGRPTARFLEEIFRDLRALAQSAGALHDISAIMYRDWILSIDLREGKVVPESDGVSSNLSRQDEGALWQVFFTAALVRRWYWSRPQSLS